MLEGSFEVEIDVVVERELVVEELGIEVVEFEVIVDEVELMDEVLAVVVDVLESVEVLEMMESSISLEFIPPPFRSCETEMAYNPVEVGMSEQFQFPERSPVSVPLNA